MVRRAILASAAAMAFAAALAPASANDHVKMTVTAFASGFANYFIAIDRGYFAAEGIDVDVVAAGGNVATPALISGDVQFSTSASIALTAIVKGAPLKIVYVDNDHQPYQLWTADPTVKTIADLKGRQVGVQTHGDTHELTVRAALAASGLDPGSVIYTPLGSRSTITAALLARSLGGASLIMDEVETLKNRPNMRLLYDLETVHLVSRGGVFTSRFLTQRHALAERFLSAAIEGARRAAAHPDDVVAAVMKRNPSITRAQLVATMAADTVDFPDGIMPLELQKREIADRADYLKVPPAQRPAPATVFDFSLLREVNASLDAQGWTP